LIGAVLGSLFGISLLSFGGFFLYKRNILNKQEQKDNIIIPGSDDYEQAERATRNKRNFINRYTYD
jgi:hypothetical protein